MNYQTVRLVSTFGSGSCVSRFGSSLKVETAAVSSFGLTQKWKLRTHFQFCAVSTVGPAQLCNRQSCTAVYKSKYPRTHNKFKTSHKMLDKSFPLENPNIFVKCLRKSHTVAIGNDFPVFCSPSVLTLSGPGGGGGLRGPDDQTHS